MAELNHSKGVHMSKKKRRNVNGTSSQSQQAHHVNRPHHIHVEPKTRAQKLFLSSIKKNKLTVCDGPAGCGKTYLAAAAAAQLLKEHSQYDHIVIVRPAVTACNEKLGYLPGSLERKMEPFTMPVLYNLSKVVGRQYFNLMTRSEIIKVIPLAYMRGLTLDNCIVIFDEAQNSTPEQMKMFLTRLGEDCKIIVEGDEGQSDIRHQNGLTDAMDRLEGMRGVGVIEMSRDDVVRSGFVADVLERYTD
jgi:phosphate starvation-inducible PhoH-like protein